MSHTSLSSTAPHRRRRFLAERSSAHSSKLKSEIGQEMKIRLPADRQTDGHSWNLDKLSSL